MRKSRKLLALIIAYLPSNAMRRQAYRFLMGYRFGRHARLGAGTVIAVNRFACGDNLTVRRGTTFKGPISVIIGNDVFIGRKNQIECGDAAADPREAHKNYAREFILGDQVLINEGHLFDVLGRIEIGCGTWVAGFASQFLTHGAGVMQRDIAIGERCFLGSAVRFAPGSSVGNDVMVGMGSVLTKKIEGDKSVVAGVPAKKIRDRDENDDYQFSRVWE